MEKSFGESMMITKENIAALLALIGKEEKNSTSPVALVMMSDLKVNLKVLFEKLCRNELDFCMVRMGKTVNMDDNYFEYGKIKKIPGVTKTLALCNFLNSIQQNATAKHIEVMTSEEGPEYYEFLVMVRDY
jgi:hypothetical protein